VATKSDRPVTLLDGRVVLPEIAGLKPTTDTVLLAAAVDAKPGMCVLDAGAGSGAGALCLAMRLPGIAVTALERESEPAAAARHNVMANDMGRSVTVVEADLADVGDLQEMAAFDVVMTNPPYLDPNRSLGSPDPLRQAATVESMTIEAWIGFCFGLLRPGGDFVMVHRADRQDAIAVTLQELGAAAVFMALRSTFSEDAPVRRVLVRATKGRDGPPHFACPLVLHELDGRYTPEADAVLRDAARLPWVALETHDTK